MGTASMHCKQQLWNLDMLWQNQSSFLIAVLGTWHFLKKHLALTLKVVFGISFEVDQSMKAQ